MATEKQYPSFENFPTIGRPNITYVAQDTGYKYIFNQGYRLVSGSAKQINGKKPTPSGKTDLNAANVGAYSIQETDNLLNVKVPTSRTITINGDTKDLSLDRSWTVGATPAGSDKQVQFNDAGNLGADADFTYDKTTNTLTTDTFKGDTLQSDSSAGVKIKSNSGSDVALFGAGGGQNATFYDGVKLDAKIASEILATDASKNIQTLSTATYPSLTELSYVKGVTSAIQTQIDAKLPIEYQSQYSLVFDDFTGSPNLTTTFTGLSNYGFISGNSASLSSSATKYNSCVGVYSLSTETSTTGNSILLGRNVFLGQGQIIIESRSTLLNTSALAQRFIYRHGLVNSTTEAGTSDGIYFRYTDNENSGNFVCVCRASSVESVVNTAVAPAISAMQKLRIVVNAAGTSAQFFIDGVSVGTIATNIPANTVALRHTLQMQKTTGTTARVLDSDYMYQLIILTIPR